MKPHPSSNKALFFYYFFLFFLSSSWALSPPSSEQPPIRVVITIRRPIHIPSAFVQKNNENAHSSTRGLCLRGGASSSSGSSSYNSDFQILPISKDQLMTLITYCYAITGLFGVSEPAILAKAFYAPVPRIGTLSNLCYEMIGSNMASIALALYMSMYYDTRIPMVDIVAVSALPNAYVTFRHMLKETTTRLGARKGVWDLIMAQYILGIFLITERIGRTETIAYAFASFPIIKGFLGMISLENAKFFYGVDIRDGASEAAYRWMSRISFQCGVLYILLLRGFSVSLAAGYLSLVCAFQCLDFAYLTEDMDGVPRQPEWIMNVLIVAWTLIGATLIRIHR